MKTVPASKLAVAMSGSPSSSKSAATYLPGAGADRERGLEGERTVPRAEKDRDLVRRESGGREVQVAVVIEVGQGDSMDLRPGVDGHGGGGERPVAVA